MEKIETIKKAKQVKEATELSHVLLRKAVSAEITDDDGMAKATKFLSIIKSQYKQTDAMRQAFVRPLNEHVSNINAFFKEITRPLNEAEVFIKNKVLHYRKEQEKIRLKEEQRLEAIRRKEQERLNRAAEKNKVEAPVLKAPAMPVAKKSVGKSTFKKVWAFRVVNPQKVPRDYLVIDEWSIRQAIRSGVREIEGVEIFQDEIMTSRI
jgi:hypothetical protein